MEVVTALTSRRPEPMTDTAPLTTTDAGRTLPVSATYLLSEEGRKASLLAGGNGRAVQELTVHVPANRLHLVDVDANGIARLKVRPRFQVNGEGVVRIDSPPTYDVPPDIEELFREAARNHQLERTYQAERRAAQANRRETESERRAQVAQAFINDPGQRALAHPAPTPQRCYLSTAHGRLAFEAHTDDTSSREVLREAHRRFWADLRARHERNRDMRASQLAVHEEKTRVIAEWIAAHGTPDQQTRQAAGVLPMKEAIDAMTAQAFASVAHQPAYVRDGAARLQTYLRQFPAYADVVISAWDLEVTSAQALTATAAQWALVQELRQVFPAGTVALRTHRLGWKHHRSAPAITVWGVVVTQKCGPFTLRREFVAPGEELAS